MNFRFLLFMIFLAGLNTSVAVASNITGEKDTLSVENPTPVLNCFQRPKFLDVNYRTLPAIQNYPTENTPESDFEGNRLFEAKLSIPIVLKSDFKLVSQLRYKNESLNLGERDENEKVVSLNNSGIAFMYQWFYREDHFLGGHVGASLKSDRYNLTRVSSQLDINTSVVWGRQRQQEIMGMGVVFARNMGRVQVLPVGIYENRLGAHWHISAYVPKELTLSRALVADNFYLIFALEGSGAAYYLQEGTLAEFSGVEYRRRSVDLRIGLEKEIKDWLWCGAYAGASQPLRSILVESGQPSRYRVHNFDQSVSPFVNVSLFAVPPRSLYQKFSGR